MNAWQYSSASVTGQSHITTSIPCQDKHVVKISEDKNWIAVAVCDGAGSAERAEIGASITSSHFCDELIKLADELNQRLPGEWINDFVINCVLNVRDKIRQHAKSDNIKQYHSTLVAALLGPSGGFSIHIGDGAILGGSFKKSSPQNNFELNSNYFISLPENGEYSNETYFITEGNWIKHLRISPLPKLDWIIACTDGGAALLLDNENQVKPSFLVPFLEPQVNCNFTDVDFTEKILSDSKANKLTTDDKTIVTVVRANVLPSQVKLSFEITIPATQSFSSTTNEKKVPDVELHSNKVLNKNAANNSKKIQEAYLFNKKKPKNKIAKFLVLLLILAAFFVFIFGASYFFTQHYQIISKPENKSTVINSPPLEKQE